MFIHAYIVHSLACVSSAKGMGRGGWRKMEEGDWGGEKGRERLQ